MTRLLFPILSLSGMLFVALVIGEFASRFIFSKEYKSSSMARYELPVAIEAYYRNSRQPLPPPSSNGEPKKYIVFIGDSFTYGDGVKFEESFPAAFARCTKRRGLDVEVLNFGVKGQSIIDHTLMLKNLLSSKLNGLNIVAVVQALTQNDRYLEHWGVHPYEVCPQYYPMSYTRDLHHYSFLAYYLDYMVNKKSHYGKTLYKDPPSERCLIEHFNEFEKITKDNGIALYRTYLLDAVNEQKSIAEMTESSAVFFEQFSQDFPAEYIQTNEAFKSLSMYSELYNQDNYHFNATANAMIGEYLCDKIQL